VTYDNVGDITIEESVSGIGLSGVIESTLTAIIFTDNFNASGNAEVKITTPGIYPPLVRFYIQKREKSGDRVKLICRSRIHTLDCPSDFVDSDFDENDKISTQAVVNRIALLGGFDGMTYQNSSVLNALPALEKSVVAGKNCLTLLENIAKALFCTFREYDGNLRLCPFEQVFTEMSDAKLLAPVKKGFDKTIGKIILTNKAETFESGYGGSSQTIKVETPFASENLCIALSDRLHGAVYKPFEAVVKTVFIPSATAFLNVDGERMYANDIKVYIKKSGLFAKISCKAVNEDEWNYESEIERKLNEKIAVGERFDALLTESKDLVGALNELFSAAPEGGDGIRSIEDLYPFMAANVWNKFYLSYDGCGFYYPEKATISNFSLTGYVCSALIMQEPVINGLTIRGNLSVYGFNTGDYSPTFVASANTQTSVILGIMSSFTLDFNFIPNGAYEYWVFSFSVDSQSQPPISNKMGSYTHITPAGATPEQIFIHTAFSSGGGISYNPSNNYNPNQATVYQGYGGTLEHFNYNREDINKAIAAFNSQGG
jgi:hypothetical protein